jgi:Cys-tRNA(Pro) deacylase
VAKPRLPSTAAIRFLKQKNAAFEIRPYAYEDKGGTSVAARQLGVDEHRVVKTLVFEDHNGAPLIVLMHGDREVSLKNLARHIGAKQVGVCTPQAAHRHTGYQVGGISPFGTRKTLPVYVEATILELPGLYINAGARGVLAEISADTLVRLLDPIRVSVGI